MQLHHVHDAFLALTTDGINFIMNSQEICDVINQCNDPKEAAQRISEQVWALGQLEELLLIQLAWKPLSQKRTKKTKRDLEENYHKCHL